MNNATTFQKPETPRQAKTFVPRVDIVESEHELTLFADLPGVRPEEIDLHYEQGELTLAAKTAPTPVSGRALVREVQEGDYLRTFKIHESIDAGRIEAEYKNGVLVVHLPKAEEAKPRQVAVKVG